MESEGENKVELSIEYCGVCNYRPIAAVLAKAVEKEIPVKPVLVHSSKMGALEVRADGELIFSKVEKGRFPQHAEIIEILKNRRRDPASK